MKNIGGTSRFVAFFDECGDHSLAKIDRDFPLFLLASARIIMLKSTAKMQQILMSLRLNLLWMTYSSFLETKEKQNFLALWKVEAGMKMLNWNVRFIN